MSTLTQNAAIEIVLSPSDIGGTNATSKYLDMANYHRVCFVAQLGLTLEGTPTAWDPADTLDTFKLKAATDSSGTNAEDITGATVTCATLGTAGDIYAIDIDAASLGINATSGLKNTHVAAYVAESDNTNPDNVTIIGIRYEPRYPYDDVTSAYTGVTG